MDLETINCVKLAKNCYQCGELVFLRELLERNSNFSEAQVESYWNDSKRPILCDICLKEKFKKVMIKLDRLFTLLAVAMLCLCIFCFVFFLFFVWFLDEIIKPIMTTEVAWITSASVSIIVFLLYLRAMRPFEAMWRKIK